MPDQTGGRPGLIIVAVLALQAEESFMDFRLGMALKAFARRRAESLVCMATVAGKLCVRACQGEDFIVVEILHPVYAIVAIQAGWSELGDVLLHKLRPAPVCLLVHLTGMAGCTGLGLEALDGFGVAARTGKGIFIKVFFVVRQAEACIYFMIE